MKDKPILVCARVDGPLLLPDNKIGRCDVCGHTVQYRPHAPRSIKRCMNCAFDMLGPDDTLETTPRMIEDAKAYLRKKQQ